MSSKYCKTCGCPEHPTHPPNKVLSVYRPYIGTGNWGDKYYGDWLVTFTNDHGLALQGCPFDIFIMNCLLGKNPEMVEEAKRLKEENKGKYE